MNRISKVLLPLIGCGMFAFAVLHVVRAGQTPPKSMPPVDPARNPFAKGLAASGIVEPDTENIAVGSHYSGVVSEVLVKVGTRVRKGQPLFRLDDRQVRAERDYRKAQLAADEARLKRLHDMPRPEELPPAEARLREAQANLVDQQDQYDRYERVPSKAVSGIEWVARKQSLQVAKEQVARARADLELLKAGAWEADKAVTAAAVAQAKAQLQMTETELARLEVRASVDGVIRQVNVRPGEFVAAAAGTPLIVLGGETLHVRADIDENDIPRFRPGMTGTAKMRGDATHTISLRFVRVEPYVVPKKSLTGMNTERVDVRVLQVIYRVEPTDPRLYVGQQVDAFFNADES